jgi:hypothetical protein
MYRDVRVHTHKPHDHIIRDLLFLFFNVRFLKSAPRLISAFISKINVHAPTRTSEIATNFNRRPLVSIETDGQASRPAAEKNVGNRQIGNFSGAGGALYGTALFVA